MTSREKLLSRPTYWFDHEQNEIFRQFYDYMERNEINQTQLSKKLGISKSRVSQILNGDLNCTLKKLIELSLAIGIVPQIKYKSLQDVFTEDKELQKHYNTHEIPPKKVASNYITPNISSLHDVNTTFGDGHSIKQLITTPKVDTVESQESYLLQA